MEDYLKVILEVLKESSEMLYVKDEEKEAEFSETRKIAEELAYNIGASLEIEDDDLFIGSRSVEFMCDEFHFNRKNLLQLLKICRRAANFEIYPRTDGKLVIGFAFTGLAKELR